MSFLHVPCEDRKQLLKEWVEKEGDAAAIEATIVVSKSSKSSMGTQRELLTVAEMHQRGFPEEKIKAITAKGGIPDEDCPHLPSLFKYWCQTSVVLKDTEEVKMQSRMTVGCTADGAAVSELMNGPAGPAQRTALPSGSMDEIMKQINAATGGQGILSSLFKSDIF